MNENCKDCPYIQNVREELQTVKADIKDMDERLVIVEKFSASGGEQIKMIFKILNEIKDSIKDIGNKIENIEQKPVHNAEKIKYIILTAFISSGIGAVFGLLIPHIK